MHNLFAWFACILTHRSSQSGHSEEAIDQVLLSVQSHVSECLPHVRGLLRATNFSRLTAAALHVAVSAIVLMVIAFSDFVCYHSSFCATTSATYWMKSPRFACNLALQCINLLIDSLCRILTAWLAGSLLRCCQARIHTHIPCRAVWSR